MIEELKLEIINLTNLNEQKTGVVVMEMGEEVTVNELIKRKEELIKERDIQIDQIVQLRNQVIK